MSFRKDYILKLWHLIHSLKENWYLKKETIKMILCDELFFWNLQQSSSCCLTLKKVPKKRKEYDLTPATFKRIFLNMSIFFFRSLSQRLSLQMGSRQKRSRLYTYRIYRSAHPLGSWNPNSSNDRQLHQGVRRWSI